MNINESLIRTDNMAIILEKLNSLINDVNKMSKEFLENLDNNILMMSRIYEIESIIIESISNFSDGEKLFLRPLENIKKMMLENISKSKIK